MKQFKVIKEFRDKYTDEHYVPGVIFVSDDPERIADLQHRGLIGVEIPQSPDVEEEGKGAEELESSNETTEEAEKSEELPEQVKESSEEVATEEVETSKDVKKNASSRKTSAKDKSV